MRLHHVLVVFVISAGTAAPAVAQRFPFEQSFDASQPATLDVSTIRGKIDVGAGEPGRIVVRGTVTVRAGFNVPLDAVDLARKLAATPPIERDGQVLRLRPPSSEAELRAVTVAYRVDVPPGTTVKTETDSGATTIRGVSGPVTVRTQSAAIALTQLGSHASVTTGSGAVTVDGVGGVLDVKTSSSAITLRSVQGGLRARTQSGAVDAVFAGLGDVDVETGSSSIRLRNIHGGLKVVTETGRVSAHGVPVGSWDVLTGSSSVDLTVATPAFAVDATNRSGTIRLEGASVQGVVSKRQIAGDVGAGGPPVRINSRSGSIDVLVAARP